MAAATRWGIISTGLIANDFAYAMKALPIDHHRVVAVAARSITDATEFKEKYGIEKAYGTYTQLAQDPDVDVVYVAAIQTQHLSLASMFLKAGKPVLCEKPMCMNVKETRKLIDLAKKKKLFLMEGIWSRFFPTYKEMMKRIRDGEIGDVVQVHATFGKSSEHVERLVKRNAGGGATLNMGVYPIQFATLVMGGDRPLQILAGGHLNDDKVDAVTSAVLVYPEGRTACLETNLRADLPCEAIVAGTKGSIKVHYPMWAPICFESPSGTFSSPLPATDHVFNFGVYSQGLMYEADEVRRCLNEGLTECPGMTHEESIIIAEIMQEIRKQLGVADRD